MALLFGLVVFAALLAGFVYSTKQPTALTTMAHDRPIAVLILLLVVTFFIIRMFGTALFFLLGIVLPLTGKSASIIPSDRFSKIMSILFSDHRSCHSSSTNLTK